MYRTRASYIHIDDVRPCTPKNKRCPCTPTPLYPVPCSPPRCTEKGRQKGGRRQRGRQEEAVHRPSARGKGKTSPIRHKPSSTMWRIAVRGSAKAGLHAISKTAIEGGVLPSNHFMDDPYPAAASDSRASANGRPPCVAGEMAFPNGSIRSHAFLPSVQQHYMHNKYRRRCIIHTASLQGSCVPNVCNQSVHVIVVARGNC